MPFPHTPTSDEARIRGAKGRESYARKREAQRAELRRQLERGECLKRAAYNAGMGYNTALIYLRAER